MGTAARTATVVGRASLEELLAAAPRRPRPTMRHDRSWYRITNQDPDAEILIYDEIGYWGVDAEAFARELKAVTAPTITVRINSPGGDVMDGLAIYASLKAHPACIKVRVDGWAASAASYIAQAADPGCLVMARNALMMIHDANGFCMGNAAAMREAADLFDLLSDNIADIYSQRAGGTAAEWRERMLDETWYTGAQAVTAGLADEMTDPDPAEEPVPEMSNRWDLTIFAKAGRPVAEPEPAPVAGEAAVAGVSAAASPAPDTTPLDKACPTHHTDTTEGAWDAGTHVGRLASPMTVATARSMYGWYDADQAGEDVLPKSACKLPHHEVSTDGEPGAANLAGVRNALSRLPQSDIPEAEQDAVRSHLRAHLDDAPDDAADDAWTAAVAALLAPPPVPTVDDLLARLREAF